jgi:PAS domain S-box-containing protein
MKINFGWPGKLTQPMRFTTLKGFDRFRVSHKIGLGYAIVLGIAIGGTTTGVWVGNHYTQKAQNYEADCRAEIKLLTRLQTHVLKARNHQQQLISLASQPPEFEQEYQQMRQSADDIQTTSTAFQQLLLPSHQRQMGHNQALQAFLTKHNSVANGYFEHLTSLINTIHPAHSDSPRAHEIAQTTLLLFTNTELALQFDELFEDLVTLIKTAEKNYEAAYQDVQTADHLHNWIIGGSMLLSMAIAGLMAILLSRAITSPLQAVEKTAQLVIQQEDFALRSLITTQDEVGSLAHSLNQLIEWVGMRTHALEQARNQLEQTVEERTQQLNAIIDNLGDGLLVTDREGQISRANPTLLNLFGWPAASLDGQSYHTLLKADLVQLIHQHQRDPSTRLTANVALAKGRIGQAKITTIAHQAGSSPLGEIILIRDITAEQEVDQMKTDFISTVSHELRTPLTSVLGFTKLIRKKLEEAVLPVVPMTDQKVGRAVRQVRDNLDIIVAEGDRLTALINDVLDIAKIEAGKVEWNMQPIAVSELLERAIAATAGLVPSGDLIINQEIAPDLPLVLGDRNRLMQVVVNLLSNAIKFTDRGTVTCRSYQQGHEILISIIDTGIGLAPADHTAVFEKFKQVGAIMTDKPRGTGLGLPICRQIVEHHGGRIWVESRLGQGSTFTFTLPLATAAPIDLNLHSLVRELSETVDRAIPLADQVTQHILVVDDEPNIRQLLRQELEAVGYQVSEAQDGVAALHQIQAHPPDLIVLDVMMPQMNGFDLAAVLKNNPQTAHIPTILLSIIQEHDRGYRLGVDRYLSKPINTEVLLTDIKTLLSQGTSAKKVLVIDADMTTLNVLTTMLVAKGYTVTEITPEAEDMAKLASQPNLIIDHVGGDVPPQLVKALRFDNGPENTFCLLVAPQVETQPVDGDRRDSAKLNPAGCDSMAPTPP